ncbi:hypothetical protein [Stutzerimonas frequens]|uniref:hypothetical protein n=1 Tax=Stutzerimonas frequens TaxID=2968969 RepID=UPI001909912F|nr:hypothetical protein [Stutzerimonas frequens]MBK3756605.1 hypothetical protein [Stutzerimonas frequens]MBK3870731.1 hypothetical protein [Stutzerimonas frequens]MBK3909068.1 hypothetical protein [Stutzerimonas frequens]MBK3929329.1 hypothetical protein [Stutzerimonas frequens]
MDQVIDIASHEDLTVRPNFRASLSFYPKAERHFGAVVAPYRFLDRIPCGIETCHTPHLSGYLITTSDGLETAIGSHCGRKHFGTSFSKEKRRVNEAVDRQRRIKLIKSMLDDMAAHLVVIEELERHYKGLSDKKNRLMGAIDISLYSSIKQRADKGQDEITKDVPMTKEEAASYFATSNRKENDGKGWPAKSVFLARLDGMAFIKARPKEMLVTTLIDPMRTLSKMGPSDIEAMKRRELTDMAKWVGEVPKSIERAQAVVEAGYRFFHSENIAKLVHLGASPSTLAGMISALREEEARAIAA